MSYNKVTISSFAGLFRERTFFYRGSEHWEIYLFSESSIKRYYWFSEVSEVENHIYVGFSRIVSSEKTKGDVVL